VTFKNRRARNLFLSKYSYCKIWSLVGENFDYGKKGEFLALDQFYSWNIYRFAQTSVFDLELVFICIDVALLFVAFDVLA
jgi:hypothetical protein